jgi:HlyD family secretion protein
VKRILVVVVLLVVVVGSGGYAVAQTRQSTSSYATAKATLADVERTLDLSGTVTATGRRDLAFGTDGTVAKVPVKAGQRVHKGQVLARLDTTALDAAVTEAVATLAKAKAQLADDEDAQATAVTAAASGSSGGANATKKPYTSAPATHAAPSKPSKPDPALQQALAQISRGQKAVTAAQSEATDAITAAKATLVDQTQACQATDGTDPDPAACTAALTAVQTAQDTVASKQDALQSALEALTGTLTKAITSVSKASQTSSSSQTQGQSTPSSQSQGAPAATASTGSPTSSSDGTGQSGANGGAVTAARLAQDQADIDTANARLGEAQADQQLATLRAPYAGRLLQVNLARGDQASSSDTAVVLVGHGVTTVTTSVSNAQVPAVRRGQAVTVTPAGWTSPLKGTVSAIGLLPDSSSAFPVTVTVQSARTVAEGSTASVSIVTGVARDAVTVPTSAISRTGTRAVVRVLDGDTLTRTVVTVGVVGERRVSISQGLKAGATVVLADLDAAVPSTTNTNVPQRSFRNAPGGNGPAVTFSSKE